MKVPRNTPSVGKRILTAGVALFAAGCSTQTQVPSAIAFNISDSNTPQKIQFCGGWGCRKGKSIGFADAQWREITSPFRKPAGSAEEERLKIAQAVGLFERHGAKLAGYENDKPETNYFGNAEGQLDCFDEATNTSNALGVFARAGLLKFHSVQQPEMRGYQYGRGGILAWRHATAVIAENGSGKRFAVDSWFYSPGKPPVILPLETWIAGWKPKDGLPA